MKSNKIKELKIYDKQLKQITSRYKICSLKINHKDNAILNPNQNKRMNYMSNKRYVEAVD
jgi:hypothetical protein